MNVALWILQGALALAFLVSGSMKVLQSTKELEQRMAWVGRFPPPVIRFIGTVEVLGAVGLILPAATGIAPLLTPVAATGLAVVMVLAAVHHSRHKELSGIVTNVVLFAIAAVVAWGRFGPYAF
jgi:uncharacterized membrane protein YphA (DoxX/SURF4 family)